MPCFGCGSDNPVPARFCQACGARLARMCDGCGAPLTPTARFCSQCGVAAAPEPAAAAPQFATPGAYTPRYLADRILASQTALEAERKQITVLFADLKGSMQLLAERDPEEAREVIDPLL